MAEYELHTKQQAVKLFTKWANAIQNKADFEPKLITVEEFKDSVSLAQQRYIFGYCYPNIIAGEIELGNALFLGMKPGQKHAKERAHYWLKYQYHYEEAPEGSGLQRIPKSLEFGRCKKDEVSTYIESLHFHAANIGIHLVAPDKKELGL